MPVQIRGNPDSSLRSIESVLRGYEAGHPGMDAVIYRRNSISIRIKVLDPRFAGVEKSDRHATLWEYLGQLPEDVQSDISMVVLLAPGEENLSMANIEFEKPSSRSLIK